MSEEHKRKIGLANSVALKGNKLSKESIEKKREKLKGKSYEELMGKEKADLLKKKKSEAQKGEKGSNWQGGISPLVWIIRRSLKYRQWRSDVYTRDDFICQICFIKGGKLEAHHIKRFAIIMRENKIKTFEDSENCEELWNINNGVTLCEKCHAKEGTHGRLPKWVDRII